MSIGEGCRLVIEGFVCCQGRLGVVDAGGDQAEGDWESRGCR